MTCETGAALMQFGFLVDIIDDNQTTCYITAEHDSFLNNW